MHGLPTDLEPLGDRLPGPPLCARRLDLNAFETLGQPPQRAYGGEPDGRIRGRRSVHDRCGLRAIALQWRFPLIRIPVHDVNIR